MEDRFFSDIEALIKSGSRQVEGVYVDIINNPCVEWTGIITHLCNGDLNLKLPTGRKLHTTTHRAVYMLKHRLLD